jgi:hypothetical protein
MSLLARRKINDLAAQTRRAIAWCLPGNRCKHDAEFIRLPVVEVFHRPQLDGRLIDDYRLQELAMAPSDCALEAWLDEEQGCFSLEAKRST